MNKIALINEDTVLKLVTRQMAFDAVRSAFESVAEGQTQICPVVHCAGLNASDQFGAKTGCDRKNRALGLKIGSYFPGNHAYGLQSHGSTTILLDPDTGFPEAIVSAKLLNGFRTAAANAIACSFLSRPESGVLAVIGAGHQAEHEIRAVAAVRKLKSIRIATRSAERGRWILEQLKDLDVPIELRSIEDAVRDADLIATVTPAREPLVQDGWVRPGTHISAMGCDQPGKQELDPRLFRRARLFADYPLQSTVNGEFQHALSAGVISGPGDIVAMGDVSRGAVEGRITPDEITIFDSSGIAIQDLVTARAILNAAKASGQVTYVDF